MSEKTLLALQRAIDQSSLWLLFAMLGGSGASVMALGLLLRGNQVLTKRAVIGTALHSVAWGVSVFLLLYDESQGMPLSFVLGVSMLSGMGAASFIDMVLMVMRQRLGISVTVTPFQGSTTKPTTKDLLP